MTRTLAALTLTFALAGGACGKHAYNRDDLTTTVALHHIDLRWGRLGNAALSVKPEMREAFIQTWTQRAQSMELQNIDVGAVVVGPDEDSADVVVTITYVERDTMTVKTETVSEKWVRTERGWVAERPAIL